MLYNELQKTNYKGIVSTQTRNHTRLYNRFNNRNVNTKKTTNSKTIFINIDQ